MPPGPPLDPQEVNWIRPALDVSTTRSVPGDGMPVRRASSRAQQPCQVQNIVPGDRARKRFGFPLHNQNYRRQVLRYPLQQVVSGFGGAGSLNLAAQQVPQVRIRRPALVQSLQPCQQEDARRSTVLQDNLARLMWDSPTVREVPHRQCERGIDPSPPAVPLKDLASIPNGHDTIQ